MCIAGFNETDAAAAWKAVLVAVVIALATAAPAAADPTLYECPGSHAHVWNPDQCPQLGGGPFSIPGSGGGSGGLLGTIGRILGGLTGGLL